jgi:hypothetical protein
MKPTIDEILHVFFLQRLDGTGGVTRKRILLIERALRACLEEVGSRILTNRDVAILTLERAIDPHDAFARTMFADDLIFALPLFISEPYLFAGLTERTLQLRITGALKRFVTRSGLVDPWELSCAIIDLDIALKQARQSRNV